MHQPNARYRNCRSPEAFEVEHCIDPGLDVAMILLDQLVRLHFAHRAVRRSLTVQRDCLRSESLTPDRFREESLSRNDIAPGAEPEVNPFLRGQLHGKDRSICHGLSHTSRRLSMNDQRISQTGPSA
jgi:hypothetical protein